VKEFRYAADYDQYLADLWQAGEEEWERRRLGLRSALKRVQILIVDAIEEQENE
jgi:hypothetical protein